MPIRLSVLGTGYLGATHAACMAELGHEVIGYDVDPAKLSALAAGEVPFYEPGLPEMVRRHTAGGGLRFTADLAEVAAFADVHFICVGTPQQSGHYGADLSHVYAVVDALAPLLERPCVVVGKSTVPVGTAQQLGDRLRGLAPVGADVELAWNPEFLREGHAVEDTLRPDRIVIGIASSGAEKAMRAVYAVPLDAGTPLVVADFATAELTKVAANAFLATKISFINAMAEVCDATGADVTRLAQALSHDSRIGGRFLAAGLGFGGGCLPKDIRAFMARAGELGVDDALAFLREVDAINMRQRTRTVALAREECGGSFLGRRVGVLGAAFKPDSDDVRDSPALNVAAAIQLEGGVVTVYDPQAVANARKVFPTLRYASSAADAAEGAHVLLHLTEWQEFRDLAPNAFGAMVSERRIVDARNVLDSARWRSAGWTYRALGRLGA